MTIKSKCEVCGFETDDLRPWGIDPNKKNICPGCGVRPDQIETTLAHLLADATGESRTPSPVEIAVFKKRLILKMLEKLSKEIKN
jgi:predicted dithiol-disulfide oxidoreductase (DUF899 family)